MSNSTWDPNIPGQVRQPGGIEPQRVSVIRAGDPRAAHARRAYADRQRHAAGPCIGGADTDRSSSGDQDGMPTHGFLPLHDRDESRQAALQLAEECGDVSPGY